MVAWAPAEHVDALIIGAGVIGLTIARALALCGYEVAIVEAERRIGSGVSSRNSEVIHAGLYYEAGSLKAQLCVRGNALLYAYCAERVVPHARCGKLIVATRHEDHTRLVALRERARQWRDGPRIASGASGAGARAGIALHRGLVVAGQRHHRQPCADAGLA